MEFNYRTLGGRLIIKGEFTTTTELFAAVGLIAEALDGDDACGKCNSPHIYPKARPAQEYVYYELVCADCGARLSFGQHKKGGSLWAKRTNESGMYLDNRGWNNFIALEAPKNEPTEPPPAQQRPAASAPRSTAQPQSAVKSEPQQMPADPRLAGLLERCEKEGAGTVFAEMIATLDGFVGSDASDSLWNDACKRFAQRNADTTAPGTYEKMVAFLLARIVVLENKKLGAA